MTKKLFLTLSIIALFTSCGARRTAVQDPATFDEGVVINGIRWATRNVDMPGTFAASPESPGMFFQWNRRKGWNTTDSIIENWDNSTPKGYIWARENDPCPKGWRVPTRAELESLNNAKSEWTTLNGINGRLFGNIPNQLFLPAMGFRDANGVLCSAGSIGCYWGSTAGVVIVASFGSTLWFHNIRNLVDSIYRGLGRSIRCVAK